MLVTVYVLQWIDAFESCNFEGRRAHLDETGLMIRSGNKGGGGTQSIIVVFMKKRIFRRYRIDDPTWHQRAGDQTPSLVPGTNASIHCTGVLVTCHNQCVTMRSVMYSYKNKLSLPNSELSSTNEHISCVNNKTFERLRL